MSPHLAHTGRGRRGAGDRRGMTLIEVMVSVAILALMGVLIYSTLAMTIKAQRRATAIQERYHAARVTLERLRRELSMAFVSLHQAEDKRTQTLFEGDRDRLDFDTMAHEAMAPDSHQSDQMEVGYRLDNVDGLPVLVRREKLHIDDRPGRGGREEVICEGVKDLRFEYFDMAAEDWRSDWKVRIEDAVDKRIALKTVRELASATQANVSTATGGNALAEVLAESATDSAADTQQTDLLDGLFLPNRVRIHLVLEDGDGGEYTLETQAEIHLTQPLWY